MEEGTQSEALKAQVKQLIRMSRNHIGASAKLCALGDDAITILCGFAQAEATRKNRILRVVRFVGRPFFGASNIAQSWLARHKEDFGVVTVPLIVFASFLAEMLHRHGLLRLAVIMVLVLCAAIGVHLVTFVPTPATDLLTRLDDVRAVAPLLDAILAYSGDRLGEDAIRRSLRRALPHLQASDEARLLPRHISAMNAEVDTYLARRSLNDDEVAYIVVVLKALEQIGDETSLECLERVLPKVTNKTVHEAAEVCLLFLQSRGTLGKHTLLRASSAGSGNLLRASQSSEAYDPNVLLRPTASSE